MNRPLHGLGLLAVIAVLGMASPLRAQQPSQPDDSLVDETPAQAEGRVFLAQDQFESWVFGSRINARAGRSWFETRLELRLAEVARVCGLTDVQRAKLQLAGRGDIERFFDLLEIKRKVFDRLKQNQNDINVLFQEIRPLQMMIQQGPFSVGSLYLKTLRRTLTPDQVERRERVLAERRAEAYRMDVETTAALLGETIGLTAEQHRRFVKMMLDAAPTPTAAPRGNVSIGLGQMLVYYRASRLPPERLRPIFDDAQWRVVSRLLQRHRAYGSTLHLNGFIDSDELEQGWPKTPEEIFAR